MNSASLNIIFAGTPTFSAVALSALLQSQHRIKAVYTQPDRPSGRGQKITMSPVKLLALEHQLPVYQPHSLRDPHEQQIISELNADVMVVVAYGLLLPPAVLTAPRLGCLNIHASLLPRWRGAAPIQRAILHGDKQTGITIMQMDAGLDTGPMLYRVPCAISTEDTTQQLQDRLAILGAEAIVHALNHLPTLKPAPQPESDVTYAHKITKEEALLNWNTPAEVLDCKVRAFNPWPIAQTYLGDTPIRIWQTQVLDATKEVTPLPGTIIQASKVGIDVVTAKHLLRIKQLQLPGGRALPVSDILNSRHDMFAVNQSFRSLP